MSEQQAQQQQQGPGPESQAQQPGADNVVDADYRDVDENK